MRSLTGLEVVRAFRKAGFEEARTSSSHVIMKRQDAPGTISIPVHAGKDIKKGTLRGIIRDSGLTVEQFWEFADQ
jgi:predicted RNA binding protein YcfA (HicA-like mRNA interferase family)